MSLPLDIIEDLFARLLGSYGDEFLRKWAAVTTQDLKTAWAHELQAFNTPAGHRAISWALDNLPERVPNAPEFRRLCSAAPRMDQQALPAPFDPEATKRGAQKLQGLRFANPDRAWAKRLAQRVASDGYRPSIAQREMLQAALPPIRETVGGE